MRKTTYSGPSGEIVRKYSCFFKYRLCLGDNSAGSHLASGAFYLQPLQPGMIANYQKFLKNNIKMYNNRYRYSPFNRWKYHCCGSGMIYSGFSLEFLEFRIRILASLIISANLEIIFKKILVINQKEESTVPTICNFLFHTTVLQSRIYSSFLLDPDPKHSKNIPCFIV